MKNHLTRDWMHRVVSLIQALLIFGGRCNHYFGVYGWKFNGKQFLHAFSLPAKIIFPKEIVFEFTENLSRD